MSIKDNMQVFKSVSNQWSIGVGLRRSTIYDTYRWQLWFNHGFESLSISWNRNPRRPIKE